MSSVELSSIEAWNEYFLNFLSELCETFPECTELIVAHSAAEAMMEEDEMSVLQRFVSEIEPHTQALTDMEEEFLLSDEVEILRQLNIAQYWTPDLDPETKNAVWQYLQTLLVMGKTILTVPPELLRMLEGYASKVTAGMGDNFDESKLDMQALGMGALQHMQQQNPQAFGNLFADQGVEASTTNNGTVNGANVVNVASGTRFAASRPVASMPLAKKPVSTTASSSSASSAATTTVPMNNTPIGFEGLQQLLQAPRGTPAFHTPGLGQQFEQVQRQVATQINGPIPYPPGARIPFTADKKKK